MNPNDTVILFSTNFIVPSISAYDFLRRYNKSSTDWLCNTILNFLYMFEFLTMYAMAALKASNSIQVVHSSWLSVPLRYKPQRLPSLVPFSLIHLCVFLFMCLRSHSRDYGVKMLIRNLSCSWKAKIAFSSILNNSPPFCHEKYIPNSP